MLSYFETLCTDNTAANSLINSSLTILFIRMLRNARAPTLRIRLARCGARERAIYIRTLVHTCPPPHPPL